MLRPLYAQQYAPLRGGRVGPFLLFALRWWREVLQFGVHEKVPLSLELCPVVELFCDARGSPPRVAAVLSDADGKWFCEYAPCEEDLVGWFVERSDHQIMGLEILAVLVGLCTFAPQLVGKVARIWEDNSGAEGSLSKGSAVSVDHNWLVHSAWLLAAKWGFGVWVERVQSHYNVADLPSRESYKALEAIGCRQVRAVVPRELPRQLLE